MIDALAYILGYLVLAGLCFIVGYLFTLLVIAVIRASSYHRFLYSVAKKNGRKLKWRKFPKSFWSNVWSHYGESAGQTRIYGPGGVWEGVGKWRSRRHTEDASNG